MPLVHLDTPLASVCTCVSSSQYPVAFPIQSLSEALPASTVLTTSFLCHLLCNKDHNKHNNTSTNNSNSRSKSHILHIPFSIYPHLPLLVPSKTGHNKILVRTNEIHLTCPSNPKFLASGKPHFCERSFSSNAT